MEHQVPLGVPPSSQSPTPRGNHWSDFFSTGLTLITVDKLFYFWTLYINIYVCAQSLHCVQLFATPWTTVCQVPLSMGFSREEYWSGLPFPPPGHLPNPGIEPGSPAFHEDSLPSEPPGKQSSLTCWGVIRALLTWRKGNTQFQRSYAT